MYCTIDDIKGQIPEDVIQQLTDDANLGAIDQAKVTEAIDNADSVIDGYCSIRYLVPFAPVPANIKPLAIALAIYNLYARKVETMPEVRKDERNNAIKMLEAISKGSIKLGEAAATAAPAASSQQSPEITSNERTFSRTSLKGL